MSLASVATPNLTEACLLTGSNYSLVMEASDRRRAVTQMARRILASGCGAVVITGIEAGDFIENCVLTDFDAEPTWVRGYRVNRHFAGTGDVFASVLCGWLLRGMPLTDAVGQATAFVCETTAATTQWQENGQDGIAFEPFLYKLSEDDDK